MTTRKKKPFWTKLLSALLIASMLVGTAGTSSLAASEDLSKTTEADAAVSKDSAGGGEKTTNTPSKTNEADVNEKDASSLDKTDTPASGTEASEDSKLANADGIQAGTSEKKEGESSSTSNESDADKNQITSVTQESETEEEQKTGDSEEEKEEVTTTYATVEDFLTAVAAVGEVDTPEDLLAAIDNCLSVYSKLSPEDQEAQAEAYNYIQSYAEDLGQSEIETLAYDPDRRIYLYINANGGSVDHAYLKKSQVNGKTLDYVVKTYFPSYWKSTNTYKQRGSNYGSWSSATYVEDTQNQDILIANWHEHSYTWVPISDTQHQQQCSCGQTNGNPQNHNRSIQSQKAATCNSVASTTYYCSTCGYTWTEYGSSYATHTWSEWYNNGNGKEQRDCNFNIHHEYRDIQTQQYTVTYMDRLMEYGKTTVNKGTKIKIIDCTNTRTDYDFKGWSKTNGGDVEYEVGDEITLNEDMTLYAVWKKKVTDNGNGISVTKTRTSINGDPSKTTAEPGDEIKWEITVTNNSNVTKTVTLQEKLAGVSLSKSNFELAAGASKTVTATYTVRKGDSGTIKNTVKASTDKTGEDKEASDSGTPIATSCKYKVQWFDNEENRIKSDATREGIAGERVSVTKADKTVNGYKYLDKDSRNVDEAELKADGSTVLRLYFVKQLWAKWVDEDGSILYGPVYFDKGKTAPAADTCEEPTKEADANNTYEFDKWERTEDGDGNITYSATYTATPKISVNYYLQRYERIGASEVFIDKAPIIRSGKVGDTVFVTDADKSISGYKFLEGDSKNIESIELKSNAGNNVLELYFAKLVTATWKDGYTNTPIKTESVAKDISDDDLKELYPTNPTRDGYTFDGWIVERDNDGNITITAQWKETTVLTVTKTADKKEVKAGDSIKYTIEVKNDGSVEAKGVKIIDVLNQNLEFESWSLDSVQQGTTEPSGNSYEIGDIGAGKTVTLIINTKVGNNVPTGTKINNVATAKYDNKPVDDPDPKGEVIVTVVSDYIPTTIEVTKEADKQNVAAGDAVEYTITVSNKGANEAKNIIVEDKLPEELELVSAKLGDENANEQGEDAYIIGNLEAGKSVKLVITAKVKDTVTVGTSIENVAIAKYDNKPVDDPDPEGKVTINVVEKDKADRKITIWYVDEAGNILKEQIVKEDPKSGDTYKKGVPYDVTSKVENKFTDEKGNNYIKDGDVVLTGTIGEDDILIKVPYTLDNIGTDPDDPDKGDNVPDKYQAVVTYRAVNGTIDGPVKAVVTLTGENGNYATAADGGKGNLTAEQIPGASANEGYGNGTWAPATPTTTYEITKDIEFVITYSQNTTTPPGENDDDDDDDDDPTPTPPTPEITPLIPEIIPAGGPTTPVVPTVTPVAATPVAPTPTAALVSPTPEAVELADEAVPLAAEEEKQPELEVVDEEETPLAGGKGGAWALINFALMNLAIFESIMLLIGYFVKTKNDEEEEKRKLKKKGIFRVISLPIAVISLIVFILTEDITLPTAFVDKYTIVMLIIAIVQTVMVALSNKKYEDEDEQEV